MLERFYKGCVLLIDAEFTCWDGSMASGWSDPGHPAEVLEVGVVAYETHSGDRVAEFSSLVKPSLNPDLSDYCLDLLPISQQQIDDVCSFSEMTVALGAWVGRWAETASPTVAWGELDRKFFELQSERDGAVDPFSGRAHVDMDAVTKELLQVAPSMRFGREGAKKTLGIASSGVRHRAIDDALELILIDRAISNMNR
jgi:inhibitor of KinA sporulation pathway (predicted exonuclease)